MEVIDFPCWQDRDVVDALPLVSVSAVALLDSDSRLLLSCRPEGKFMSGLWEFPGGKINSGELPEAAAVRELDEELGVETRQSCLAPLSFVEHAYEDFHLLLLLYICRQWRGVVRGRDGQLLKWVRLVDLASYPQPPANLHLCAMLRDLL